MKVPEEEFGGTDADLVGALMRSLETLFKSLEALMRCLETLEFFAAYRESANKPPKASVATCEAEH